MRLRRKGQDEHTRSCIPMATLHMASYITFAAKQPRRGWVRGGPIAPGFMLLCLYQVVFSCVGDSRPSFL